MVCGGFAGSFDFGNRRPKCIGMSDHGPSTSPVKQRHPALVALDNAPFDDEPVTDAEEALIEEARADVRAGRVVNHEDVKRRVLNDDK